MLPSVARTVKKGKRTGVFSKKIKRARFSMLYFRAQKTIQSEFIALSPFLPMRFLNNFGITINQDGKKRSALELLSFKFLNILRCVIKLVCEEKSSFRLFNIPLTISLT